MEIISIVVFSLWLTCAIGKNTFENCRKTPLRLIFSTVLSIILNYYSCISCNVNSKYYYFSVM